MAKNIILTCYLIFLSFLPCAAQHNSSLRDAIQKTYTSQIGVRELTGRNDGKEVEMYLAYVWLKKGQPWCAAGVSWCFGQNGIKKARSGGCVQLMEQGTTIYINGKVKAVPQKADVLFIWFAEKGRVAHTGFIDKWSDTWVNSVEGNTNQAGSREGDGWYRKKRLKRQIYAVAKYVD